MIINVITLVLYKRNILLNSLSAFFFLNRIEHDNSREAQDAVRNLVLMISSLCMCGYIELKPSQASTDSLFQMAGFNLPQPSGRGK